MIRRADDEGVILFTQDDHARYSGELAAAWGNEEFDAPGEGLAYAAAWHDAGWTAHDAPPLLNEKQEPLDVFEAPLETALAAWRESADLAERFERGRAALLVSLHVMGLSGYAAAHATDRGKKFEINKFQQREAEREQALRAGLGLRTDLPLTLGLAAAGTSREEDGLIFDYWILQAVDRISLGACCTKVVFPATPNVRRRAGEPGGPLKIERIDAHTLTVDPWPFNRARIDAQIPCRRLRQRVFDDAGALARAVEAAPREMFKITAARREQ